MTQKELSYVEDATCHQKSIIQILEETKNNLENEELINFICEEIEKHTILQEKLINMLEEKANG